MKSFLSSSLLLITASLLLLGTVAAAGPHGDNSNSNTIRGTNPSSGGRRRQLVDTINAIESNGESGLIASMIQASSGNASRRSRSFTSNGNIKGEALVSDSTRSHAVRGGKGGKKGNGKKNKKNKKNGKGTKGSKGKGGKGGGSGKGKGKGAKGDNYYSGKGSHSGGRDEGSNDSKIIIHYHDWANGDSDRTEINHSHEGGNQPHNHNPEDILDIENAFVDSPTSQPTMSVAPTTTAAPVEPIAYCKTFPATYKVSEDRTETVILIWQPDTVRDNEATAIAALNSIVKPPIYESDTDRYNIAVTFSIKPNEANIDDADTDGDQDFDLTDVGKHLDNIVSPPVVLVVAGCNKKAQEEAEVYYYANKKDDNRRRTQADGSESKLAIMRDWICVYNNDSGEDVCDANTEVCVVTCETSINYMGLLGLDAMKTTLNNALGAYFAMVDNVVVWYEPQTVTVNIEQVPTDSNNISEANDTIELEQRKSAVKAGPYIGAATGLLALLLLLLLFVRRRSRYDDEEVSHLKMDDDDDDDTFLKDYAGSDDNSIPRNEYQSRDIHIVGEGDSVISHWTGYTRKSDGNYEMEYNKCGPVNGITTDVHQCSSATCEICAKNRQAGLSFVSTGANNEDLTTRSRSLPSDASRDYPAEDTVEL